MAWSTGGFTFSTAGPDDEPEIRRLVGSTPMPGALSIRFEREPDYFLGCDIMGRAYEVLLARDDASGELAGMACRAEDEVYDDGIPTRVGYISQVRIAARFRGLRLLDMGWPVFRNHAIPYLGVIASGNPAAVTALVERAPGAPSLTRIGGVTTFGFPVHRRRGRPTRHGGVEVVPADAGDIDAVVAFLNAEGRRLRFAPVRRAEDFTGGRRMRGLDASSIFLAHGPRGIAGTLALWDQRTYKQDVVDSYGPSLARARPVLDVALRALGAAALPRPGSRIEGAFAALPVVAEDDPAVFAALLDAVLAQARSRRLEWVTLGLSDDDPLASVARRRLHITYRSDLYAASWGPSLPAPGRARPYVEAATL